MNYWATYRLSDGEHIENVLGDPRTTEGAQWDADTMGTIELGPDRPDTRPLTWDKSALCYTDNLDRLRADKWELIKTEREARRVVITTPFGVFDADETAKSNLLGRLAAYGVGATGDVTWKLHDNTFVTLDQADFTAACMAVMSGVEAVYAASFELEAALNSATTAEDIAAIDVTAGWP